MISMHNYNLFNILINVPYFFVFLAGIALSIVFFRRYPRTSLFALMAFVLLLIETIGGIVFQVVMDNLMRRGIEMPASNIYMVVACIRVLINAAAWVLVLIAIFIPRGEEK